MWVLGVASVLWALLTLFSIKGAASPAERMGRRETDVLRGSAIAMITIHHAVTNCYEELPRCFAVFVPLGAFGTAVFFFLSGYGNALSLRSERLSTSTSNNWNGGGWWNIWLIRRMGRLLSSFLIVLCFYALLLAASGNPVLTDAPTVFFLRSLTLTLPPTTTWYLKIQLLAYCLHAFCHRVFPEERDATVLTALLVVYSVAMYAAHFPDFWWSSAACYGAGACAAVWRGGVERVLTAPVVTVSATGIAAVAYLFALKAHHGAFVMCLAGTLALCGVLMRLRLHSVALERVGQVSFELYLTQSCLVTLILLKRDWNLEARMAVYLALTVLTAFSVGRTSQGLLAVVTRRSDAA